MQENRLRYYIASISRWTSRDPVGLLSGDTNLYRYVHNDAFNSTDPMGLQDVPSVEHKLDREMEQRIREKKDKRIDEFRKAFKTNRIEPELATQIMDPLLNTPPPWGWDKCIRWADKVEPLLPPRGFGDIVEGAPSLKVRKVAWTYDPVIDNGWTFFGAVSGHFAFRVDFPDRQTFYVDDGNWSGVFYSERVRKWAHGGK